VRFRTHRNFKIAAPLAIAFALCCVFICGLARPQTPAQQQTPPAPPPAATAPVPAPQLPPPRLAFAVVLDPGHGGTDSGARGTTGAVEKDLTLAMARAARIQFLQQGLRVILTREGDENPSFDDRATIANALRSSIFISLHVSSTGTAGTARAYSYLFSTNVAPSSAESTEEVAGSAAHLIAWQTAQETYVDASHRLADLIQADLAQRFPGSPTMSTPFPVRDLRSVAAPAVAVELSSVSVEDPHSLDPMISTLAASVARSVAAFRSTYAGAGR